MPATSLNAHNGYKADRTAAAAAAALAAAAADHGPRVVPLGRAGSVLQSAPQPVQQGRGHVKLPLSTCPVSAALPFLRKRPPTKPAQSTHPTTPPPPPTPHTPRALRRTLPRLLWRGHRRAAAAHRHRQSLGPQQAGRQTRPPVAAPAAPAAGGVAAVAAAAAAAGRHTSYSRWPTMHTARLACGGGAGGGQARRR